MSLRIGSGFTEGYIRFYVSVLLYCENVLNTGMEMYHEVWSLDVNGVKMCPFGKEVQESAFFKDIHRI